MNQINLPSYYAGSGVARNMTMIPKKLKQAGYSTHMIGETRHRTIENCHLRISPNMGNQNSPRERLNTSNESRGGERIHAAVDAVGVCRFEQRDQSAGPPQASPTRLDHARSSGFATEEASAPARRARNALCEAGCTREDAPAQPNLDLARE